MHKIMTDLHQDHVNLAKLLTLLEQQADLLATGGEADLLLMTDIADYIRRYSDQIHHPKEDTIYEVFSARSSDAATVIAGLLVEHQDLPTITHAFQGLLDNVINSAILSRQELQGKITAFIEAQKAHLNTEEAELFPLINSTLDAADWVAVEQSVEEHSDPLFGHQLMERYRNVHQLVMRQRA
ncbi:MAG: hypothetical protein BWK73_47725 [Thiothrix lacustris]|uniref:Hemerythrin-like domain-containing protein n=1 Tax=Thiothrix lacustris TaxID=525917 RepID=A0A1Y1Q9N0_9GAMM|nr:MAG: hypothetical protein BWK73_47725 [Thiothrix lacustris]